MDETSLGGGDTRDALLVHCLSQQRPSFEYSQRMRKCATFTRPNQSVGKGRFVFCQPRHVTSMRTVGLSDKMLRVLAKLAH
ncbi:hypothetical protein CEXT_257161 [Caerostris extrusa]|uniref:Uncharacterized protein n=1 Tax=Caerostris extrusa TaxID=172846 RepID=A0AAV4X6P6_CAEEX|nr:hypothetical protein CEXT_257161 [Caerostris extrusa]